MKQLLIACTVTALLLAAVGCGASKPIAGPASYMTDSKSKVVFIHWRPTSRGRLSGTITEDSLSGSGPAQALSVSSEPFIGVVSGNSVLLTFANLYFLHTHAHGALSGSTLTLAVPQPDGAIGQTRLVRSDKASYDRAVSALRGRIRHANVAAANQQAGQRQHPMNAAAEQSTQSSLATLYRDSNLAPGGILTSRMTHFEHHILVAQSHLATERKDSFGDNRYCVAALKVTGDSKTIDGSFQTVQGDVLAVMPDISAVRHYVASASAQLRHLNRAGLPAPVRASEVIANAEVGLNQTIAVANSYISEINAIDARAHSIANNLSTGKCSGAQSGVVVHPIPPVK